MMSFNALGRFGPVEISTLGDVEEKFTSAFRVSSWKPNHPAVAARPPPWSP